jgi:hypothetical protein
MPCPTVQVIFTAPLAGEANWNRYGPASFPETLVAATPLIRRSAASSPNIGSLKVTSMASSSRTVELAGDLLATVGATVSVSAYCRGAHAERVQRLRWILKINDAVGAVPRHENCALGRLGKVNVAAARTATDSAGDPLINRSDASTRTPAR